MESTEPIEPVYGESTEDLERAVFEESTDDH
jgi:hypothetical protein